MCFKKMRNDPYIKAFKNPMKRLSAIKISTYQENNWDSKIAYSDPIKQDSKPIELYQVKEFNLTGKISKKRFRKRYGKKSVYSESLNLAGVNWYLKDINSSDKSIVKPPVHVKSNFKQ